MTTLPKDIVMERIGRPHFYSGYAFGYRSACLCYRVKFNVDNSNLSSSVKDFLMSNVELLNATGPISAKSDSCRTLTTWVGPILKKAGHPVFESARNINHPSLPQAEALILQPCFNPVATLLAIDFVIGLLNEQNEDLTSGHRWPRYWKEKFEKLIQSLNRTGLHGFNPIHFLSAAHELGIPWAHLGGNLIQVGIGKRARWIDSSFTDKTPMISTKIARDKTATASLLEKAGLPVPRHVFVADPESAVKNAESLGYPVVIKPANLDGGRGVRANLCEGDAVRKAFNEARKLSDQILVEKHVPGRDYRLQVVNGTVQGILERIPGGVIGNGASSILELVEQQNKERKHAQDDRRYLHPIARDDESDAQLSMQGFCWASVPEVGSFVRLRGAANVASGGIPKPVSIEEAHPDNLGLAIRAVRILKLDVAGVDLIIPDIRQSWLETGGYICEVNAQPQMFTTMHKPMLASLFSDGGSRVPVVINITANPTDGDLCWQIQRQLVQQGLQAGLVHGDTLWLGAECVRRDVESAFFGARMLSYDQAVEAIVIGCKDTSFFQRGWPFDRCNVLIIESLPSVSDMVQSLLSFRDWLNAAATLGMEILIVPERDRTEIENVLKFWKRQPRTIYINFDNPKEVDGKVATILSALGVISRTGTSFSSFRPNAP